MIKTYKAFTVVSLNVNVGGYARHISFEPKTLGGSTYTTDDEEEQKALESCGSFNKIFRLEEEKEDAPADSGEKTPATEKDAPAEDKTPGMKKVVMPDISAAKEYLADTFDLSRTSLRSESAIMKAAAEHNIELVIED